MDQKFIDIARVELGETETKKEQSLAHLRSWISKHPFLSKIRQDDVHLLQFLRLRKYSMDATFETIQNYYLAPKVYPELCNFGEGEYDRLFKLFDSGLFVALPKRDKDGRRIVLLRFSMYDLSIYTPADAMKFITYCFMVLLEEEETQISGVVVIFDFDKFTMKNLLSPTQFRDWLSVSKNAAILRQKGNFFINLPSFASFLVDGLKSVMSAKLSKRIFVLKNAYDELKKHVEPSLLPKELGGVQPAAEMLEEFKKLAIERRHLLRLVTHPDIDWNKVSSKMLNPNGEREAVGSFRKLEID